MSTPPAESVEGLVRALGDPGRYQVLVMVLLCFNYVPVSVNHLLMAFHGFAPEHNCRLPDQWPRNVSLPTVAPTIGDPRYQSCSMYVDPANHSWGTKDCIYGYEFHVEGLEWTVVSEWGLVCDRKYLVSIITTLYFVGVMVGGLVFGALADRFGRQPMMLLCLYVQLILGAGLFFVRRLIIFIAVRVLQGFFVQGLQTTTYSMVMELFPPHHRTLAGVAAEVFWAIGLILLAVCCYFVQHWRHVQLAISIPTLVTLLYIWLIPESLRWLISRGRSRRARVVAERIAYYNGLRLSPELLLQLEKLCSSVGAHSAKGVDITDLFRTPAIRRNSFVLFIAWFTISLAYYGISLNIADLSGNRFFNFMLGGALELVAFLLTYVSLRAVGRRACLVSYLFLSGALLIGTVATEKLLHTELISVPTLVTSLALLGKAAVVSCFCAVFLVTSEAFPTVIRSLAMGACVCWARAGSLVAPQVLRLADISYSWMPFLVFGCLALLCGFLGLLLPETGRRALPDTIQQAERSRKHDQDDIISDVGYGASPRWIVQDGLIVSRPADGSVRGSPERVPHWAASETSTDDDEKFSYPPRSIDDSSLLRFVGDKTVVHSSNSHGDFKQHVVLCDIDETRL
ncbi:Organic cation transporter-like protein [Amphibalanus amphitrite]|uniref:Organic cation transporter-like protein n=1 Tax=Amphibalanus amphitrite TaxID=1232801 RepID=A0A6A4VF86_AMPAM|nr:Organic cation transporter-like protein [Amphibalanus amphitrite]